MLAPDQLAVSGAAPDADETPRTLLEACRELHATGVTTYRRLDHPMNLAVEQHLAFRDLMERRRRPDRGFNTQAVHGTPITPKRLLNQMQGASFCVSYFNPEQLDDVIPLLGIDSILLLDNGAFSAWQKGITLDDAYWDGFWQWALPVIDSIPQAVAIIPDVIGGTVAENRRLWTQTPDAVWGRESQMMTVWHLNEPLEVIEDMMAAGFGRIAFGSAGDFRSVGTNLWRNRVHAAFDYIDELVGDGLQGYFRPRIHMLRGLAQLTAGEFPFDSADSTNIAVNHCRLKGTSVEKTRVAAMRTRIEAGAFPTPKSALWPLNSWMPTVTPGEEPLRRPMQSDLFAA